MPVVLWAPVEAEVHMPGCAPFIFLQEPLWSFRWRPQVRETPALVQGIPVVIRFSIAPLGLVMTALTRYPFVRKAAVAVMGPVVLVVLVARREAVSVHSSGAAVVVVQELGPSAGAAEERGVLMDMVPRPPTQLVLLQMPA